MPFTHGNKTKETDTEILLDHTNIIISILGGFEQIHFNYCALKAGTEYSQTTQRIHMLESHIFNAYYWEQQEEIGYVVHCKCLLVNCKYFFVINSKRVL